MIFNMKMAKIFLLCGLFFATILPLQAEKVDVEKAETVGQQFVQSKRGTISKPHLLLKYASTHGSDRRTDVLARLQHNEPLTTLDTAYYYVFNIDETIAGGFVIVAGDDAVRPVLGYSCNGRYDADNIPPGFTYWMDFLQEQIAYAQTNNLPQSQEVKAEWAAFTNSGNGIISLSSSSVEPLIQTKWNQYSPYNLLCPVFSDNRRAPTGCVATAMAHVINYHQFPPTGSGSSTPYTLSSSGVYIPETSFEINYDWANMLNEYGSGATTQQQNAVATLMYHCGISVRMNYTPSESGAASEVVAEALRKNFGYGNVQFMSRTSNESSWEEILRTQIDAGLPVYYAGQGNAGGHAFICDGYDNEGRFHFNWGWGGASDGYFLTSALNAGGYNFSSNQRIIINIEPTQGLLKNLEISEGALSPTFRPYVLNYTINVDASVETIDITGITDIPGVVVANAVNVPLGLDDYTDIPIIVTDSEGKSQTYMITVLRGEIPPISFTWDIYNPQQTARFKLGRPPTEESVIDWGDGTQITHRSGGIISYPMLPYITHTYDEPGTYHVKIRCLNETGSTVMAFIQNPDGNEQNNYRLTQLNLRVAELLDYVMVRNADNTTLDISRNNRLTELYWTDGKLQTINVDGNESLNILHCFNNAIPLINLHNLTQQINHVGTKLLGDQQLPDSIILFNTTVAIDTVFYGLNTVFDVSDGVSGTNYLQNNDGSITFLTTGNYTVTTRNPALISNSSHPARVIQLFRVVHPVHEIILDRNETSIPQGTTTKLTVTLEPFGADFNDIEWKSDNTSIATVDADGLVTALARGEAVITAAALHGDAFAICKITVVPSNDATLNNITVSSGTLSPAFSAKTTEYTVNVANSVTNISITGVANYENAIVEGNVTDMILNVGANEVIITVTADDETTIEKYKITVVRVGANDATLKNLTVSSGELSPAFNTNETQYGVIVENDVTSITITVEVNHENATADKVIDKSLNVGENEINIVVTAEDGVTTKTYTVTVVREEKPTSAEDIFTYRLKIYPNPFTDAVRIVGAEGTELKLFSANGIIIHLQKIEKTDEIIRLNNLPAGVYFFCFEKDGNYKSLRVVKNN